MTDKQDAQDRLNTHLYCAEEALSQGLDDFGSAVLAGFNNGDADGYAYQRKRDAREAINAAIIQIIDARLALAFARIGGTI